MNRQQLVVRSVVGCICAVTSVASNGSPEDGSPTRSVKTATVVGEPEIQGVAGSLTLGAATGAGGDENKREVRVSLVVTDYLIELTPVGAGAERGEQQKLRCYELRATGLAEAFSWAMWASRDSELWTMVQILHAEDGAAYLAWVQRNALRFVRVSEVRPAVASLFEHIGKHDPVVETVSISGTPQYSIGVYGSGIHAQVMSIQTPKDGSWEVTIRDAAGVDFVFAKRERRWVLEKTIEKEMTK